jgi:hypothetical protein
MFDPEIFAVLCRKVNRFLSITRNTLIYGDSSDSSPGKSLLELVEDHEECQTVLSP